MTDRELLELAAKAAGYQGLYADNERPCGEGFWIDEFTCWNPLEDDGDAFRLAMALDIDIVNAFGTRTVLSQETSGYAAEGADSYAATRRAIVQTAAEIGKSC